MLPAAGAWKDCTQGVRNLEEAFHSLVEEASHSPASADHNLEEVAPHSQAVAYRHHMGPVDSQLARGRLQVADSPPAAGIRAADSLLAEVLRNLLGVARSLSEPLAAGSCLREPGN